MSKRRGHGDGALYRKGKDLWVAVLDDGWSDGKRKRYWYYGRTQAEARQKLEDAQDRVRDGLPAKESKQTVEAYLKSWLDSVRPPRLQSRTWHRYEELVRLHVVPALGSIQLSRLDPSDLRTLYSKLERHEVGGETVGKLARKTIRQLHAMLHAALEQAAADRLVTRNVADLVKAPKADGREMTALSPEQTRSLLAAVKGDRLEALYVLALHTGMRQGELLGLRWRDIDFDAGALRVEQTLQKVPRTENANGYQFGAPKTEKSRRRIELSTTVVDALRRHRVVQARISDLVFTNAAGGPLDGPNLLHRHFYPLVKRAGLVTDAGEPLVRFHDLRHTMATLLLLAGQDVTTVSQRLGHSSPATTLKRFRQSVCKRHQATFPLVRVIGLPSANLLPS